MQDQGLKSRTFYHARQSAIIFSVLAMLLGPAAFLQGNNFLMWAFACFIGGALASLAFSGTLLAGLQVIRIQGGSPRVGQLFSLTYLVKSHSSWLPNFSVTLIEKKHASKLKVRRLAWLMFLLPKNALKVESILEPKCRGKIRLKEIYAESSFPLGILRRRVVFKQVSDLIVHPRLWKIPSDFFIFQSSSPGEGKRAIRRGSVGEEFFGLRSFAQDDSIRDIAWRSSARRDQLISIQRSRPTPPQFRIILNLNCPDEFNIKHQEFAIELAASLLVHLYERKFEISLTVMGAGGRPSLMGYSPGHLEALLRTLALLDLKAIKKSSGQNLMRERSNRIYIHIGSACDTNIRPSIDIDASRGRYVFSPTQKIELKGGI